MPSRRRFLQFVGGGAVSSGAWMLADDGKANELNAIPGDGSDPDHPDREGPLPPTKPMPKLDAAPHPAYTYDDIRKIERGMHDAVNERREEAGLQRVEYSENLAYVARFHSHEMYVEDFVGHFDEIDQGKEAGYDPGDRLEHWGYRAGEFYWGENAMGSTWYPGDHDPEKLTAYGEPISIDFNDSFYESPSHRRMMLSERVDTVGIGVVIGVQEEDKGEENPAADCRATQVYTGPSANGVPEGEPTPVRW
jgi:uncharacterized protein YkwD